MDNDLPRRSRVDLAPFQAIQTAVGETRRDRDALGQVLAGLKQLDSPTRNTPYSVDLPERDV